MIITNHPQATCVLYLGNRNNIEKGGCQNNIQWHSFISGKKILKKSVIGHYKIYKNLQNSAILKVNSFSSYLIALSAPAQ